MRTSKIHLSPAKSIRTMKKPLKSKPEPSAPPAKRPAPVGRKTPASAKSGAAKANQSELARRHGVSRETIRAWRTEGLDISDEKAVADRVARMPGRDPDATGEGESLAEAKRRRAVADANRAEVIARRESGELVSLAQVEDAMSQLGFEMRSRLLSWIGNLPPMLEGLDAARIQAILREKVTELLASIHENAPWKN
jgi:transposase-like protein